MKPKNEINDLLEADDVSIDNFDGATENLKSHVHRRDIIRRNLAYQLLWLMGAVILILVIGTVTEHVPLETAKDLAGFILAPLIGIFATVIGFFFGAESR